MAGIRGQRAVMPKKGGKPTGIFSTRGRQKQDGVTSKETSLLNYAHSGGGEISGKPKGDNRSLRHQKHYGKGA